MGGTGTRSPSGHVLLEPLERRLWPSLEFEVAIPACRRAADPEELLVGGRDIVKHRLHVARVRQHVVMHLKQKRRDADVSCPFLWCARSESDARAEDDSSFQIIDTIGWHSGKGQSSRHDDPHRDWLGPDEASHTVEGVTIF